MIMSARCALQTNSCLSCILTLDNECILSRVMQAAMIDFHDCLVLVGDIHETRCRKAMSECYDRKQYEQVIKSIQTYHSNSRSDLLRFARPRN